MAPLNIVMKDVIIPENFCLAPWLHAHHGTDYTRKLCSMSDYIFLENGTLHNPHDLTEYQNSDFNKRIRRQMMNNEMPDECYQCHIPGGKVTRVNSYKDSFNKRYKKFYSEALEKTQPDGSTTMPMRSFDYRFDSLCNYKCRHCDWFASSAIEQEEKLAGLRHAGDDYILPEFNQEEKELRQSHLLSEMKTAADAGTLDYIQWVGGEPLFHADHWEFMNYLIENCDYKKIYISYITNLSIMKFKGYDFVDMINKFDMSYVHASIESGGVAAEYIRTGLTWEKWKQNFAAVHESFRYKEVTEEYEHTIKAGITLTTVSLPGMRDFIEFLVEQQANVASATLIKPNDNNWHLGLDFLGEYRTQWVQEFRSIVEDYKDTLLPYSYFQLTSIADIIEKRPILDLNNLTEHELERLKRSVHWANKTDEIRKSYLIDVIKDYPFMLEWWEKVNSLVK